MDNSYSIEITEGFIRIANEFKTMGIISPADLNNYGELVEHDLHSWLCYALIRAGDESGLFAVPEVKLRFENKPIFRKDYELADKGKRTQKRTWKKVDVCFYRKSSRDILGCAEVFTLDEAHACLGTKWRIKQLDDEEATSKLSVEVGDVLVHMARHSDPKLHFVILVVNLPKKAIRIPWKIAPKIDADLRKDFNYYRVLKTCWTRLRDKIGNTGVDTSLVILSEDKIERVID